MHFDKSFNIQNKIKYFIKYISLAGNIVIWTISVVWGNNTSFTYETHDKDIINLATFFCLQNFGTLPTICEEYTTIACFQLNYRFKSPPWICPKASNVGKSKKHHNLGTRSLSNNTSRNTWAVCVYMHHVCLLCTTVHAILNVRLT